MTVTTIALSGLQAATARLNASASNVANMNTRGAIPTAGAPSAPAVYRPVRAVQTSAGAGGGVAGALIQATPGWSAAYDPSAPFADPAGMVAAPDVDLAAETVEQLDAHSQFVANLRVLQTEDSMLKTLIDRKA
jgi:flagellar basal-body rod protein FlgC